MLSSTQMMQTMCINTAIHTKISLQSRSPPNPYIRQGGTQGYPYLVSNPTYTAPFGPMNRPPAYYSPNTPPPTQQTNSGYVPPPPVPQPTYVRSALPQPPPQHTRQYYHQAGRQHYVPPHMLHQRDEGAIQQNFALSGQFSMIQKHNQEPFDNMQQPAIHQESATRIKINSINNGIYPEGRKTSRIEHSHCIKAECHEDIGSPRASGVVVGEYRESEITPSLVSQKSF